MAMEIDIVSRELIKPTSPTPKHLRTHKFSFLDQSHHPTYIPMVLFYANQETSISSQLLKDSLAETLTLFNPFAGRIKDRLSVDCNNEGAYYLEARVNRPLCDFLELNDSSNVPQLLPVEASWTRTSPDGYLAMIQVTTFTCGGVAIGASLSHMIADGPAATTFLASWAAATRKCVDEEAARPNFDASFVFPQNVAYPKEATFAALFTPFYKKGICRSTRIVFDASAIDALKAKAASSSVPDPTRVEVVSALLCKCITATSNAKSTLVTHPVNLRERAVPKFTKYSMGNFVYMAAVVVTETETELCNVVCRLRKANSDYVSAIQGDGGCAKYCEHIKEIGAANTDDIIGFTSWCNFGLYDIDFGWGKPAWVTCTTSTKSETVFMKFIALMDTKTGDGIEAVVYLDEEIMVMLEQNKELLAFGVLGTNPVSLPPFSFPFSPPSVKYRYLHYQI